MENIKTDEQWFAEFDSAALQMKQAIMKCENYKIVVSKKRF